MWKDVFALHPAGCCARQSLREAPRVHNPYNRGWMPFTEQYDLAVVGAGHAGCEAAMAAAR
ncbi:MAG TPA: hypothetical protein VGR64_09635, partial [Terracidiphilus sp.]|nr:hypothetical protein [Terracidiphilus sp.]